MAISFKEQIDNFSNDFYINTAYIPLSGSYTNLHIASQFALR